MCITRCTPLDKIEAARSLHSVQQCVPTDLTCNKLRLWRVQLHLAEPAVIHLAKPPHQPCWGEICATCAIDCLHNLKYKGERKSKFLLHLLHLFISQTKYLLYYVILISTVQSNMLHSNYASY